MVQIHYNRLFFENLSCHESQTVSQKSDGSSVLLTVEMVFIVAAPFRSRA